VALAPRASEALQRLPRIVQGSRLGVRELSHQRHPLSGLPKGCQANPELLDTKAAIENLLGSDEDGIASTFEDFNL
jgi:hypothetical protein